MWGQCRGQCVMLPTETPFDSVQDVFAAMCSVPVTPVPIVVTPMLVLSVFFMQETAVLLQISSGGAIDVTLS